MELIQSIMLLVLVLIVPKLRKAYFFPSCNFSHDSKVEGRIVFFDFARGIAITAVVLIHSIYLFFEKYPYFNTFWLNNINNLSRFAVGFFFISSGALLTSGITKEKIVRVFVPYVIVCVITGILQQKSLNLIIGGIFRGDLLPPYYFIPVLFQFYLIFPLLKKFRHKKYFLFVSILISYLFYMTPRLAYIAGVPTFGPFLFLFAFGIVYSEKLKSKTPFENINFWLLITPIYIGLQFILTGHYFNSRYFYAPAFLISIHYTWYKFDFLKKLNFFVMFGKLSLWIYLVHFSVQSFLVRLIIYDFSYLVFVYIFLISALTAIASGIISAILDKIYQGVYKLTNARAYK